jgi:hypothetical protein
MLSLDWKTREERKLEAREAGNRLVVEDKASGESLKLELHAK